MAEPHPDSEVAKELEAISARLAAIASDPPDPALIDAELITIRTQLRMLAEDNAQVRARLPMLRPSDPPAD